MVNIPVGEVFTSPQLAGTNGLLHVSQVYLNELKYVELKVWFKDGRIENWSCGNFADDEANPGTTSSKMSCITTRRAAR